MHHPFQEVLKTALQILGVAHFFRSRMARYSLLAVYAGMPGSIHLSSFARNRWMGSTLVDFDNSVRTTFWNFLRSVRPRPAWSRSSGSELAPITFKLERSNPQSCRSLLQAKMSAMVPSLNQANHFEYLCSSSIWLIALRMLWYFESMLRPPYLWFSKQ